MYHFGSADKSISPADVERCVRRARRRRCTRYDGAGHGFNCDQRASYNPQLRQLARSRTLEFLAQHLSGAAAGAEDRWRSIQL